MKHILLFCILFVVFSLVSFIPLPSSHSEKSSPEVSKAVEVEKEMTEADIRDSLRYYLKTYKVKYPDLVYVQSLIETKHFTSRLCRENRNLFGFKTAHSRPTSSISPKYKVAHYKSFRESVLDYCFYQSSFIYKIGSEEAYMDYLIKNNYANDQLYLKNMLRKTRQSKPEKESFGIISLKPRALKENRPVSTNVLPPEVQKARKM